MYPVSKLHESNLHYYWMFNHKLIKSIICVLQLIIPMHINLKIEKPALSRQQSMYCTIQFLTVHFAKNLHDTIEMKIPKMHDFLCVKFHGFS